MALVKCKECGNQISSKAPSCPQCGAKNQSAGLGKGIIGTLLALAAIGYCSSPKNGATTTGATSAMSTTTKLAKIGDTVQVGNFVYRVDKTSYRKSVGNSFVTKTADGVYLIVNLTIKNVSKESRTLDGSMFKLVDSAGREFDYSVEGSTALQMSGTETIFLKDCHPEIQTSGVLIFEVPSQETRLILKVSGGFWSGATANIGLS